MQNYKVEVKSSKEVKVISAKNEAELKLIINRIYGKNVKYHYTKI